MKEIYVVHVTTESSDHYYFAFKKEPTRKQIEALMGHEADYIGNIEIQLVEIEE